MPQNTIKSALLALLLLSVVLFQVGYDAVRPAIPSSASSGFSPAVIRAVDMGFHAAIGSFFWISAMPEILDVFARGKLEYLSDEKYVNAVDPKLSYPYAFTALTLPSAVRYAGGVRDALAIGEQGIRDADPDWRLPYYMATDYFLYLKDVKDALWYYNIAARMPDIPDYALRFSLNFGIKSNERSKTEDLWATIRDSTNDADTKDRAQANIDRLEIFDYLDAASRAYRQKYGKFPAAPDALVAGSIIPTVPADPFGFPFVINPDGTAGINTTSSFSVPVGER